MTSPVLWEEENGFVTLRLNRAARCNALTGELLEALEEALDRAANAPPKGVILTGDGPHFSTGGDVAAFAKAVERGEGRAEATRVVGALHRVIMALLQLPVPVMVELRGATTGGSVGLVLASDMVAMHSTAFLQPFYSVVGFAPDGGWTAMLPERIGAGPAAAALMLNRRIGADEARALGLATELGDDPSAITARWRATLDGHRAGAMATAKALIWSAPRLARVRAGLDAEQAAFVARIEDEETKLGMRDFLGERRSA